MPNKTFAKATHLWYDADKGGDNVVFVWLGALVAFIVIEAMTVQLLTIWFALGSLAALIAALCSASMPLQIGIFVAVSIVALIVTRPLVKKFTGLKYSPTNADRFIGETTIVTQTIDNIRESGLVKVKGSVWTARSADNSIIGEGETVTVKQIEGVKVIVEKAAETAQIN